MKLGAKQAVCDFARLASRGASDLYGLQFLKAGFSLPLGDAFERFPGIHSWGGTRQLKIDLRCFAKAPPTSTCLLASRSTNLMRFAAEVMSQRCRRALVLDLCWKPFVSIARRTFRRSGTEPLPLDIRSSASTSRMSAADIATTIASAFVDRNCDGIFLPAVSHDGIRLPVDLILKQIRASGAKVFSVVDGSQAFGHVADNIGMLSADVFLCGAHKWLGAGMPLGISFVSEELRALCQRRSVDDPLSRFVEGLEQGTSTGVETVNVWPLIACYGALKEVGDGGQIDRSLKERRWNSAHVRISLGGTAWLSRNLHPELSSGIEVFTCKRSASGFDHHAWRSRLGARGIAASTYEGPMLRISMPDLPFSKRAIDQVRKALAS